MKLHNAAIQKSMRVSKYIMNHEYISALFLVGGFNPIGVKRNFHTFHPLASFTPPTQHSEHPRCASCAFGMSSHRAEIDIQPFWLLTTFFSPVGFRTTIILVGVYHLPKGSTIFKDGGNDFQGFCIARIEDGLQGLNVIEDYLLRITIIQLSSMHFCIIG